MRILLLGLLMLGLLSTVTLAQKQKELEVGTPMPLADRPMKNVDGRVFTLNDLKGEKGLVVVFWSNTCPWVAKYEDRLLDLARTYQEKGFGFVAVNANDPKAYPQESLEEMKKRAISRDYPFPYLVDEGSKLAATYGATRTPHVYVFDAEGKLVYVGAIDDSPADPRQVERAYLKEVLDALLAGKEVPVTHSRAFGCTIKWYKGQAGSK